jgi:replicative DNA helicase
VRQQRKPAPVFERTPPQNVEAERACLGAALLNKVAACEVVGRADPGWWYSEAHRHIWEAMAGLVQAGKEVDYLTLSEALMRRGQMEAAGGAGYLAELTNAVPTSANVELYLEIVEGAWIRREAILGAQAILGRAYGGADETEEFLGEVEAFALGLCRRQGGRGPEGVGVTLEPVVNRLMTMHERQGLEGIGSGLADLDGLIGGWKRGEMIVVGARPSVGKTSFALHLAQWAALREGARVCVFSLEMGREALVSRLLCSLAEVDARNLKWAGKTRSAAPRLSEAVGRLSAVADRLLIDDTAGLTGAQLRTRAMQAHLEGGLDLVVVDYLQLLTTGRREENRQVEMATLSRNVKGLARDLNVPVIALSQVTRDADDGPPRLSQIRESGAIEQDADVVLFLTKVMADGGGEKPLLRVDVAKHRNGPTGDVTVYFERSTQRIGNVGQGKDEGGKVYEGQTAASYSNVNEFDDGDFEEVGVEEEPF